NGWPSVHLQLYPKKSQPATTLHRRTKMKLTSLRSATRTRLFDGLSSMQEHAPRSTSCSAWERRTQLGGTRALMTRLVSFHPSGRSKPIRNEQPVTATVGVTACPAPAAANGLRETFAAWSCAR